MSLVPAAYLPFRGCCGAIRRTCIRNVVSYLSPPPAALLS